MKKPNKNQKKPTNFSLNNLPHPYTTKRAPQRPTLPAVTRPIYHINLHNLSAPLRAITESSLPKMQTESPCTSPGQPTVHTIIHRQKRPPFLLHIKIHRLAIHWIHHAQLSTTEEVRLVSSADHPQKPLLLDQILKIAPSSQTCH